MLGGAHAGLPETSTDAVYSHSGYKNIAHSNGKHAATTGAVPGQEAPATQGQGREATQGQGPYTHAGYTNVGGGDGGPGPDPGTHAPGAVPVHEATQGQGQEAAQGRTPYVAHPAPFVHASAYQCPLKRPLRGRVRGRAWHAQHVLCTRQRIRGPLTPRHGLVFNSAGIRTPGTRTWAG